MARYIDADVLKSNLIGDIDCHDTWVKIDVVVSCIERFIDQAPTADVTPKTEVAREIFTDIESKLSERFPSRSFANAPYTMHERLIVMLTDLKEKYTEGDGETKCVENSMP